MNRGKLYVILGSSGCGKTTLLSQNGHLDRPASRKVLFKDKDIEQTGLAAHREKWGLTKDYYLDEEPTGDFDEETAASVTEISPFL